MTRVWQGANALMLLMFVFAVIVQFNDPDPVRWAAMYAAAALVCGVELARRARWWQAGSVALIALYWAATIAPRVVGKVPFLSMFEEFEMKDIHVEESREMYGLVLIALWMIAVLVSALRRRLRLRIPPDANAPRA